MGNNFNPNCISSPTEMPSKSDIINTDSTISTPLISFLSSTSFNLTVSISLQTLDLHRILSNYCQGNYNILNSMPLETQNINQSTHKQFVVECDQQTTFYTILKQFSLTHLLEIHAIKVCIIDGINDAIEIENLDQTIFNNNNSEQDFSKISILLYDNWHSNKLNKITQIDALINNLIFETKMQCNKLRECKSLEILLLKYDAINNAILSKFVDIDALIDMHGNDIATMECLVLPYHNTNKNRMLKQVIRKINKMDYDLQNIALKWSIESMEIEKYLANALDEYTKKVLRQYKLWSTEQVIYWIQFILKDEITFDDKDVENLKIANIAGININNMDRDILELIGIEDEMLQNIIIASIQNIIIASIHDTKLNGYLE